MNNMDNIDNMNLKKLYTNFFQHVNNMTDDEIKEAIKIAEQNSIDEKDFENKNNKRDKIL